MIGRRQPPPEPPQITFYRMVCARFKIPVTRVPLWTQSFDGTSLPWSYRAVNN